MELQNVVAYVSDIFSNGKKLDHVNAESKHKSTSSVMRAAEHPGSRRKLGG